MQEKLRFDLPTIDFRTEHVRNGQIFRGHPQYRKQQWNDWAIFDWGVKGGHMPAEIWCFADLRDLKEGVSVKVGDCNVKRGVYAVIESGCYLDEMEDKVRKQKHSSAELFQG